jgi:heterotetrameric sarcosine oxidase gamma subunit
VAELLEKSPCAGLLPLTHGGVTVSEVALGALTSVSAWRGKDKDLSEALKAAHGMAAPSTGRATGKEGARAIWFGHDTLLLAGPHPDAKLATLAALIDQSDAWACVRIEGDGTETVLARLVPVDLRASVFKRGHTARTLVGHMSASVTRIADSAFLILVFRSMATTLVHELETAMRAVASRAEG